MTKEIYSVSRLNREVRQRLESSFGNLWLEAELSNLATPTSGHWYFSLKDSNAQIRCAMFKGHNRHVDFKPQDGDQVLVKANVSLYEARGDFQLIIEKMQIAGEGALQRKFDDIKKQLQAEGLFATEHKQALPALPKKIGVITSSTGAAIHDILTVLNRRFPAIPVVIYPCLVQGDSAANDICHGIKLANQRQECDVLIVARGGGSLEDLWPFNQINVARAIFASAIPIVTGIGHEVDVTIADFIADQRAATPSAAAELVSPDKQEWLNDLLALQQALVQKIQQLLQHKQQHLRWLNARMQHPGQRLQQQMQRLDYLTQQLKQAMLSQLKQQQNNLASLGRALQAYSPLSTLGRGYSITRTKQQVISSSSQVECGDQLQITLAKGKLNCEVIEIYE